MCEAPSGARRAAKKNWFAHLLGSAIRLVVVVIRFHVVSKAENALALVLAFINNFGVVVVLHGLLLLFEVRLLVGGHRDNRSSPSAACGVHVDVPRANQVAVECGRRIVPKRQRTNAPPNHAKPVRTTRTSSQALP